MATHVGQAQQPSTERSGSPAPKGVEPPTAATAAMQRLVRQNSPLLRVPPPLPPCVEEEEGDDGATPLAASPNTDAKMRAALALAGFELPLSPPLSAAELAAAANASRRLTQQKPSPLAALEQRMGVEEGSLKRSPDALDPIVE